MNDSKDAPEDLSFADAMQGVTRHQHDKADLKQAAKLRSKSELQYRRSAALKEDTPVIDGLSDEQVSLVASSEELLFAGPGIQLRVLKRLKQGHIPWQQGLDLHGYTVEQARDQVSRFIYDARKQQHRCVLLVHGKSHSSENQQATLKSYVNEWLRRLNGVLAFCSAQPKDGGAGALYILLKKD